MRVVVDGEASSEADVISGVPQRTVLGPLLFLCHINDLPECVTSSVRLFADDCLLYRANQSPADQLALQTDLTSLDQWATDWGLRFNAKKCYILPTKKKFMHFYQLNETILKEVTHSPYLGVTISDDLKWTTHINNVCKSASCTLGFIRRNLRHCPTQTRRTAYVSLVRSTLEYASAIWDPSLQTDITQLEGVQRKAVRCRDYHSRDPGCVTNMLESQNLPSLQRRRKEIRPSLLCKVVEGLVPAVPAQVFLTLITNKRHIKAKTFTDCVTKNFVEKKHLNNSRCFVVPPSHTETRRQIKIH